MQGILYGVGVGPGDPELVTVKARRVIESADVVAYPLGPGKEGVARRAAAPYLANQAQLVLEYPVTTQEPDHPGGYEGALRDFYDASAARIAAELDAGRSVAVLCEGDPFFYGSYMYLHERLAARYAWEVVPGVTAFSAAAAAAGTPLAKRDDVLTVLPGTLPPAELAARVRDCHAAVVMKLGRRFGAVREGLEDVADRAVYVERASHPGERIAPLAGVEGSVPYMSLVLVPTASTRPSPGAARAGQLAVVGLGPAGAQWLTPEAGDALHRAEHLVGYAPYLARVPVRSGQQRHASDNRAELQRARHALELAAGGARVAVVSSGDPGIFAMAAAVLEALEAGNGDHGTVDISVLPGLSAMQAAAARVGAPLGHDFAVVSLSDQRKPWDVIERRLEAAAGADYAIAIYNPASKARRDQLDRAREVLRRHRDGETPVVVARDVGGPAEDVAVTDLDRLAAARVDMRTLLIVGSSQTRVLAGPGGSPLVYTPRSYPA
ncbi:MAG: precorrin-3B C(17)-methyltransferase [Solirubrobacteraceae bacterium]